MSETEAPGERGGRGAARHQVAPHLAARPGVRGDTEGFLRWAFQRWRRAQICHADALSVRRIASMRVPARARRDFYIPCRPSCVILFVVDLPLCSRSHVMFRCLAPNRHATQHGHVQGTQVGHWHQEGAGRATGYKERKMRSAGCCGREVRGELCSPCARCAGCRCVHCVRIGLAARIMLCNAAERV